MYVYPHFRKLTGYNARKKLKSSPLHWLSFVILNYLSNLFPVTPCIFNVSASNHSCSTAENVTRRLSHEERFKYQYKNQLYQNLNYQYKN